MNPKPWYKSLTVWASIVGVAIGCVGVIAGSDLIAEYPKLTAACGVIGGILGVVLRAITKQPITLKP